MKVGIIKFQPIHVNLNHIWDAPDYVVEVWNGGVKVDLDLARVHCDNDWVLLKKEVCNEIANAILAYIDVLEDDHDKIIC